MSEILELLKNKNIDGARELFAAREVADDSKLLEVRDAEGFSLLHWAALRGFSELLLYLLNHGADPNVRGSNEQTPLMWAAVNQELLSMHILLDYGAQLRAVDNISDNAFLLACQHDKLFAALWLLGRGADVRSANIAGATAAHWAAFSGSYMLMCLLDAFGLDLEQAHDQNGLLPLHRSLELEFWGTARMMVSFNPYLLRAKTNNGMTLDAFAEDRCLPRQTYDSWKALCRDASYKPPAAEGAAAGVDLGEMGDNRGLQKRLWKYLVGFLDYLDETPSRRKLIPVLAYGFAAFFVAAHVAYLSLPNQYLAAHLGFTRIERLLIGLILTWLPKIGFIAIFAFSALMVLNPGFESQNFVSKVLDGSSVKVGEETRPLTVARILDLKSELHRQEEQVINLDDEKSGRTKINLLRRRRRLIFDEMLSYLSSPEALYLFGEPVRQSREPLVAQYLERKGVALEALTAYGNRAAIARTAERLDLGRVCPTCWIRRGLRTKHCSSCDRCCEIMDHHCVWINCCVGKNSHACFALFIITGYLSQAHQIVLLGLTALLSVVSLAVRLAGRRALFGGKLAAPSPMQVALLAFAGALHFITFSWSSQLFKAQWKNIFGGYTVNESLNEARYEHFIVAAACDSTGLPTGPDLTTPIPPPKSLLTEGGHDLPRKPPVRYKKNGRELEPEPSADAPTASAPPTTTPPGAAALKKELVEGVVEQVPVITDAPDLVEKDVLMVRRFLRNPFAANLSAVENCLQFWTNSRPAEVAYELLDDRAFIEEMRRDILRRRKPLF